MTDYMKEAKRLAQAYADAVLLGDGNDEALAALLAHIQRGVPEGYDIAPSFRGYAKLGAYDGRRRTRATCRITDGQTGHEGASMSREAFEAWWEKDGQFCRAGGGDYEKTFALRALAEGAQG